MTTVSAVISVVGGVLALAGLLGVAWAVFRTRLQQTTIELYRADNEALRARVDTLEAERNRDRTRLEEMHGELVALREERALLRDLATGTTALAELHELVSRQHAETVSLLRKITTDRRTA